MSEKIAKIAEEIKPFENKVWLATPTMHGDEQRWVDDAIITNWVSTVGENIDVVEKEMCELIGCKYAVGLSSGTAALHLAVRLCAERIYGKPKAGVGTLKGHKVFCSDMTFSATVNPVAYEGGEAVFIDTEPDTWNMDPAALDKAFELYPDVRLVVVVHLYGTPCRIEEIKEICERHGALLVEDAAESLGATYKGKQTGTFGDVAAISFNGNKVITGSSGGMLLTNCVEDQLQVRKWSTQSRENAPWYQHEEMGYNYRMSNIIAGVVRGQIPYLDLHIEQKRQIYKRYQEGLKDMPIIMNPFCKEVSNPNHWLSCMMVKEDYMSRQERSATESFYNAEKGKTCPSEILGVLSAINAEGRPIWKPMHMQPIYRENDFVTLQDRFSVGEDIFRRGLCLPSDNKMTEEQQDIIIDAIRKCFE